MIGLYLAALLFGGSVIVLSLFLGGHDSAAHPSSNGDSDAHPSHGDTHHEGLWLPFLSIRFWTFLAASFGLTGLLLSLVGLPNWLGFLLALANSAIIGTAVAYFFRTLSREQVSGDIDLGRLVGQEAHVLLPVRPGELGKIAVDTLAGRVELPAKTRDADGLERGQLALVAHVEAGVAEVTALPGPHGPLARSQNLSA